MSIKTPHAAVVVWPYVDRLSHEQSSEVQDVHRTKEIIFGTISLINLQTNKTKSQPNGSFSFILGARRNWVSGIAPGSWCAILISQDPISFKQDRKAKPNELKFFGRINSVRCSVHVDENGARQTAYICEGEDWGSIFNTVLYTDPSIRQPTDNVVGTASSLIFGDLILEMVSGKSGMPTTTHIVKALLKLWGDQPEMIANAMAAYEAAGGSGSD